MTSRKADKKLDLKVRRVLKTNVRGGIMEIAVLGGGGGAVAASEDAQSQLGPGPRGPSYGSRMPTYEAPVASAQLPGLSGGIKVSV